MRWRCGLGDMLVEPSGPRRIGGSDTNGALGDTIPLGKRTLRVTEKRRDDDADQPPV
jgi:hypothetical protein